LPQTTSSTGPNPTATSSHQQQRSPPAAGATRHRRPQHRARATASRSTSARFPSAAGGHHRPSRTTFAPRPPDTHQQDNLDLGQVETSSTRHPPPIFPPSPSSAHHARRIKDFLIGRCLRTNGNSLGHYLGGSSRPRHNRTILPMWLLRLKNRRDMDRQHDHILQRDRRTGESRVGVSLTTIFPGHLVSR